MSRRYIGSLIDAFNTLKVANAPTIGTATAGNTQVCVTFTAPSCVGGGAVTGYTAVSCPGFKTGTGTTSPITVACLTNCTAYTFRVNATNVFGPSVFSAASSSVTPTPVGSFAIFKLGICPTGRTTTNKYTYSGDVNAVATSLTAASYYGAAAGNSTRGIFALGFSGCFQTYTRNKYTYAGCTVSAGTNASNQNAKGSATGNSTRGIFALGYNCGNQTSTTRNKYTYSGDTSGAAAAAGLSTAMGSAVGSCSVGIFALGAICCCGGYYPISTRDKYTYSSCTSGSATAASTCKANGAATGNSTVGIFALGGATTTRNKYTYSGDTNVVATASSAVSNNASAAGNSTVGIFALGCSSGASTTRNKYTYSGCVNASATASSATNNFGSAASNGTTGVNV